MLGLEDTIVDVEWRLTFSILIALLALGLVFGIRKFRRRIRGTVRPITLDIISSSAIAGIVIVTAIIIMDVWGQTEVVSDELGFLRLDEQAPELIVTIVVIIAIQVFVGISRRLLNDLADDSGTLTDHQRAIGIRMSQLGFWTVGLIVILGVWDIDLTGLLVGAGFLGIVLGLAARKTLGSLIAGLVLMFSRPFEVGDWVLVDGSEGIVTDITLMSTRIRAFDGEHIIVPNDVVTGEIVTNRTREGRLRVDVPIGIDYDDDVEHASDLARSVLDDIVDEREYCLSDPEPNVILQELADSAVIFSLRIWITNPSASRRNRLRQAIQRRVKSAFTAAGLTIPFPQREISTREGEIRINREGKREE